VSEDVQVYGVAVIDDTPIPNMPLSFNGATVLTDQFGSFQATLVNTGSYIIRSGLPETEGLSAIWFTQLEGTGQQLADASPMTIAMQRRVMLRAPVCRKVVAGAEQVFFPYLNTASVPLNVPLGYGSLNSIESFSGAVQPPVEFEPGASGFSRDLSFFVQGNVFAGRWKIGGQQLEITGSPPLCTDGGDLGDCTAVDMARFERVLKLTRSVVQYQITTANGLAGRTWRPDPANRLLVFNRGARALATIRKSIAQYENTWSCTGAIPAQCRVLSVDKQNLRLTFHRLYLGLPRGLSGLLRLEKEQKASFDRVLKGLPDQVVSCD